MAIIEKQTLISSKDADGNTIMHFPVTHVNYVENAVSQDDLENITVKSVDKLTTPRNINGVAFDGSEDITIVNSIAQGGTGATSAANARGNLGLATAVTAASISGKVITLTFADGTTQTLTTQDTTGLATSSTITVTKSTQGAFTPSVVNQYSIGSTGSTSSTTYTQVKVPTVVAGITAGSYTIQNLFQQLVNKSHTHSNTTLNVIKSLNCNCCDGSCFIAGTLVLMADKTWKKIEDVQEGEYVIGMDGKPNRVITPYQAWLGNKRAMLTLSDGSLTWSAEHLIWMRGEDKKEFWGTYDFHQYLREHTGFIEYQGKQYSYKGLTKDLPIIVTEDMEFAHIEEGWKPVDVRMAREYDETTLVYSLLTDGSHSFIANGYIVSGFTDDTVYNYKEYRRDNVDFKNHP